MIVAKRYQGLVSDVRGLGDLGDPVDAAVAAGAVTASAQADQQPQASFWRPVLIGTLTAAAAWLVTRALESAFGVDGEADELDDEDEADVDLEVEDEDDGDDGDPEGDPG